MKKLHLQTASRSQFLDITELVQRAARELGVTAGALTVFVPHTTAGVTINEHADPEVAGDVMRALDRMVPWTHPDYRHDEGNTAAHVKAILTGSSVRVPVEGGRLQLGTWQGIFFCEFDGPRSREVWISSP
jgi:secondary thiamine-phosphate synthase enzyme